MACELASQITSFTPATHLLGCVAHVIDLVAKVIIAALGTIEDEEDHHGHTVNMDNKTLVKMSAIVKRIHGLCTYVRFSSTRRKQFEFATAVNFAQPDLYKKEVRCLEINVSTQWNSTLTMFGCVILLKKLCNGFVPNNPKTPLPVYINLVQHLKLVVQEELSNRSGLSQPANEVINKVDQYLLNALRKPIYIIVMVLDPKFKTAFWKNNTAFINKHYQLSVDDITITFCNTAQDFEVLFTSTQPPSTESTIQPLPGPSSKHGALLAKPLYQSAPPVKGIQAEINTTSRKI
ncbi:hypothetical protein MJO29_012011 [Puccinia striiformis f. sp. tritici]|nr:hypothetical protein MJO29_012011 [Puccinia striiformis f. sp. tritici]